MIARGLLMYMQFPQPPLSYIVKYWNIFHINTRINEPEVTNLVVLQYVGRKDKNVQTAVSHNNI